jgi:hypothetical protein
VKNSLFSKAIFYTILNYGLKLGSSPIQILFIALFLSPMEQGYWFTFISLVGLMMLVDLGITNIIVQYASYEFAHLKLDANGQLIGDQSIIERLSSLFIFSMKWILYSLIIAVPIIFLLSYFIISKDFQNHQWVLPFFLFLVATGISYFLNGLLFFLDGLDLIQENQKVRLIITLINQGVIWFCLYSGMKLYSLSIALLISTMLTLGYVLFRYKNLFAFLIAYSKKGLTQWGKEISPLFWKYALSWISGYLIFQVYSPLSFKFYGPEISGKIGLSITICMSILTMSNVWITVATPNFHRLASTKQWDIYESELIKVVWRCCLTFVMIIVSFYFALHYIDRYFPIIHRFLLGTPFLVLSIGIFFQVIINAIALYLRAEKEEPLFILSVVSALFVFFCTLVSINLLDYNYLFHGFTFSYILGLPWILYLLVKIRKRRREDQQNAAKKDIADNSDSNL